MKVVFIAIKGIDIMGGIETYTLELGKRLVADGHEVIVYCMKDKRHDTTFKHEGITFIPLPTIHHKYLEKMVMVFMASLHQLKIRDINIVHYHAVGPSIFSFIPRLFNRYTVFQSHGHEWERDSWNILAKVFFRLSESLTFSFVNDSTAVSKNLKHYYQEKYKKSVSYIPSGIDPRPPQSLQKNLKHGVQPEEYLLYVGRLSKEKRVDDLIKAFTSIQNRKVKLVIVGKARPDDQAYDQELKQLAAGHRDVIFTGAAYGDELVEWYSNALAYVLPSAMEGLPITLLEAMSFSRCCIASDIAANCEALDDKGLIYPLADQHELQEKLEWVIAHPQQAKAHGTKLYQHVCANYTWAHIATEFGKFYQKAANTKNIATDKPAQP